jgi:hypothetical protein
MRLPSAEFESDFRGFAGHCIAPHKAQQVSYLLTYMYAVNLL